MIGHAVLVIARRRLLLSCSPTQTPTYIHYTNRRLDENDSTHGHCAQSPPWFVSLSLPSLPLRTTTSLLDHGRHSATVHFLDFLRRAVMLLHAVCIPINGGCSEKASQKLSNLSFWLYDPPLKTNKQTMQDHQSIYTNTRYTTCRFQLGKNAKSATSVHAHQMRNDQ